MIRQEQISLNYREAGASDVDLLARLNQQLIRDEGHRNPMTLPELKERMARWLAGEYKVVLFERGGETLGYTLFRHEPEHVYIRQFFVEPEFRRQGVGRTAMDWLCNNAWDGSRIRLDVLVGNETAIAFWRSVGFHDYCITMERDGGVKGTSLIIDDRQGVPLTSSSEPPPERIDTF